MMKTNETTGITRKFDSDKAMAEPTKSPELAAQEAMRPPLPKRFYKTAKAQSCPEDDASFCIMLDGRTLKTPGKNIVGLPTQVSAQLVAEEWQAQKENIDPVTMPMTRLVNTAIDGIAGEPQPVIEDMLKFASSDLLCYRTASPEGLVANQRQHWDPVLSWLENECGAQFNLSEGVQYIIQPKESVSAVGQMLRQWKDPIAIGALHTFATMTGSIFLALALATKFVDVEQCWNAAHVDEDWNISQWGEDIEAQSRRKKRWQEFKACERLLRALDN